MAAKKSAAMPPILKLNERDVFTVRDVIEGGQMVLGDVGAGKTRPPANKPPKKG